MSSARPRWSSGAGRPCGVAQDGREGLSLHTQQPVAGCRQPGSKVGGGSAARSEARREARLQLPQRPLHPVPHTLAGPASRTSGSQALAPYPTDKDRSA